VAGTAGTSLKAGRKSPIDGLITNNTRRIKCLVRTARCRQGSLSGSPISLSGREQGEKAVGVTYHRACNIVSVCVS
jgi:hypothetical protein